MPVLQLYLVADAYPAENLDSLLKEASDFYVQAMYPDTVPPPIERVRAFICNIEDRHWATGGVPISQGGKLAPYFTCMALAGRPAEQIEAMANGLTHLLAKHLACDASIVRGQVISIPPDHWFIGGEPASRLRGVEIAKRADTQS